MAYFASFLEAFFGFDVFAVLAAPDAAFAFADIFFEAGFFAGFFSVALCAGSC